MTIMVSMTASEYLIEARAKIDTPEKWCRKVSCRNAQGAVSHYAEAVSYCAFGAVDSLGPNWDSWGDPRSPALNEAFDILNHACISDKGFVIFNDAPDTTHADVMMMFDRAIQIAQEAEK